MRKNYQIHLNIESEAIEELKKEANSRGMLLSNLIREKLKQGNILKRIEIKLDKLISKHEAPN